MERYHRLGVGVYGKIKSQAFGTKIQTPFSRVCSSEEVSQDTHYKFLLAKYSGLTTAT